MRLSTKIERTKEQLKQKVEQEGLYENFGQNEVRKLKDKYIDISKYTEDMNSKRSMIQDFNKWCMNYTG